MRKILCYILLFVLICFAIPILFTIQNNEKTVAQVNVNNDDNNSNVENVENQENSDKKVSYDYKEYNTIKLLHVDTSTIEEIPLDEYIYSVVAAEMPASFEKEALKAQAVVARTYTFEKMQSNAHGDCDICDNYACCQAYYNKEKILEIWTSRGFDEDIRKKYWSNVEEAVYSTNNIVITYKGEYIKAYFHANSGGKTESSTEIWGKQKLDYLVPVESLGEENHSQYKSEVTFTYDELEEKLTKGSDKRCEVNSIEKIKIIDYTVSGRVARVQIGNNMYEATALRTLLGLKSTNFNVEEVDNKVVFKVTGYGHGLGMSQTGSNYYASQGYTYDEIIKHYYTGVDITKVEENE